MKISACLIMKNEERYLEACLASLKPVVSEIIVMDTGSTDASTDIASAAGALVYEMPWPNDFSMARNACKAHAGGDWILSIDADERLDSKFGQKLAKLSLDQCDALRVNVLNRDRSGEYVSRQVRLFRNRPEYGYEGRIHEQIAPSILQQGGHILDADLRIIHLGYSEDQVQGSRSRTERNLHLLELELEHHPNDAYLWYQLGATHLRDGAAHKALAAFAQVQRLGVSKLGSDLEFWFHSKKAQALLDENQFKDAKSSARKALHIREDPVPMLVLWTCLLALREFEDLAVLSRKLMDVHPDPEVRQNVHLIAETLGISLS